MLFLLILISVVTLALAGDDASVHVHVESAPGPESAMRLPLFNYYRSAMGAPPSPELAASLSKWHGDEVHSQGPDVTPPLPVAPLNSAEQTHSHRPLRIAPPPEYAQLRERNPYGPTQMAQPDREFYGPSQSSYSRTSSDYVIPFPQRRDHNQPRHVHGSAGTVPPWVLRKKSLSKYGIRKYLQPNSGETLPVSRGDAFERLQRYDPDAEPIYPRTRRLEADYSRYPQYDHEGLDY